MEGGDLWSTLASFLQKEAFLSPPKIADFDLKLAKKTWKTRKC